MIVCTAKVRSEPGERVRFPIMPRALGLLIKTAADERPSRYRYYVPLPDLLMDIVERDSAAPQAERIGELAHSFAHDVLNLAVLASRLLWYEALTPDMNRSPDLVAVGTDTEASPAVRASCSTTCRAHSCRTSPHSSQQFAPSPGRVSLPFQRC